MTPTPKPARSGTSPKASANSSSVAQTVRLRALNVAKLASSRAQGLRVVTPDGKCPLCKIGEVADRAMLGPVEIGICRSCSGMLFSGLSVAQAAVGFLKKWVSKP
jgi:hypothetical protein